jgi:hypothetical protein
MTKPREICAEFTESREKRKAKREKRNAKYQGPMTKELKTYNCLRLQGGMEDLVREKRKIGE